MIYVIIWLACAVIGHMIGRPKGYPYAGLLPGRL
jgi:hypothetical protein